MRLLTEEEARETSATSLAMCDHCGMRPATKNWSLCRECDDRYYAWCLDEHKKAQSGLKRS